MAIYIAVREFDDKTIVVDSVFKDYNAAMAYIKGKDTWIKWSILTRYLPDITSAV